jgi:hypothetical protein
MRVRGWCVPVRAWAGGREGGHLLRRGPEGELALELEDLEVEHRRLPLRLRLLLRGQVVLVLVLARRSL